MIIIIFSHVKNKALHMHKINIGKYLPASIEDGRGEIIKESKGVSSCCKQYQEVIQMLSHTLKRIDRQSFLTQNIRITLQEVHLENQIHPNFRQSRQNILLHHQFDFKPDSRMAWNLPKGLHNVLQTSS